MVKIKVSFNDKVFCHEFISQQRYTPIPPAMRQQSSESLPGSGKLVVVHLILFLNE